MEKNPFSKRFFKEDSDDPSVTKEEIKESIENTRNAFVTPEEQEAEHIEDSDLRKEAKKILKKESMDEALNNLSSSLIGRFLTNTYTKEDLEMLKPYISEEDIRLFEEKLEANTEESGPFREPDRPALRKTLKGVQERNRDDIQWVVKEE